MGPRRALTVLATGALLALAGCGDEDSESPDGGFEITGAWKGVGTVTLAPAGEDRLSYSFRGGGVESTVTLRRLNP